MICKKCGTDTWVGIGTCLCDNCKDTNKKEAQQAQTIEKIRLELQYDAAEDVPDYEQLFDMAVKLLEIVDSQSQKIAEQAKEIERIKREFEGFKDGVGWRPPEPEQTTDSKEVAR